MEECPSIYAELLLNIRQIAIYISFPAEKTAAESSENKAEPTECTLQLADSGDSISLCYGGRTLNFNLPARVAPSFASMLQSHELPTWPCREAQTVSFRVPASLPSHVTGIKEDLSMGHAWSARDMDISARICCRNCHHELVHSRIDLTDDAKLPKALCWKDLPSADWAELMELWHCHKPDEPHGEHEHDVNGNVKGYGASNQVVCNPGDVLVDVTSFYASEVNCSVIKEMVSLFRSYFAPAFCCWMSPSPFSPGIKEGVQIVRWHCLLDAAICLLNGLASDTTALEQNPRALFSETLGIWLSPK